MIRVLFILLCALPAFAATYYVDFDAGSDAANGTSTETPWKHCHGDANATGNAASTAPSAGDIVQFKGGVVYVPHVTGIVIGHSGTEASPITYDGNSAGTWGTGKAIIDGNHVENAIGLNFESSGISWNTVRHFEIRNMGGFADDSTNVTSAAAGTWTNGIAERRNGWGIEANSGTYTGLVFSSLYVHRIGNWRNTIGWEDCSWGGCGIILSGPVGCTVTNVEMTKTSNLGLGLYARSNLLNTLVTDCYLHENINWAIDVAITATNGRIDGLTITKSRFLNLNQSGGDFAQGVTCDNLHQNYIFLRTDAGTTPANAATVWTNVTVSRCLFGDTNDAPAGTGGTGAIFLSSGPSCNIYNNVFAQNWSTTGTIPVYYETVSPLFQIVRIYNNTFYFRCSGSPVTLESETGPEREVYVENNIFALVRGYNIVAINSGLDNGPKIADYNLYFAEESSEAVRTVMTYNSIGRTLAQVKVLGWETNGFWGDPLFVSTNRNSMDLSISEGSPAIGAGRNLSAYFNTDYAGNARPASAAWTIGAYEYTGDPAPSPPTTRSLNVGRISVGTIRVGL